MNTQRRAHDRQAALISIDTRISMYRFRRSASVQRREQLYMWCVAVSLLEDHATATQGAAARITCTSLGGRQLSALRRACSATMAVSLDTPTQSDRTGSYQSFLAKALGQKLATLGILAISLSPSLSRRSAKYPNLNFRHSHTHIHSRIHNQLDAGSIWSRQCRKHAHAQIVADSRKP